MHWLYFDTFGVTIKDDFFMIFDYMFVKEAWRYHQGTDVKWASLSLAISTAFV